MPPVGKAGTSAEPFFDLTRAPDLEKKRFELVFALGAWYPLDPIPKAVTDLLQKISELVKHRLHRVKRARQLASEISRSRRKPYHETIGWDDFALLAFGDLIDKGYLARFRLEGKVVEAWPPVAREFCHYVVYALWLHHTILSARGLCQGRESLSFDRATHHGLSAADGSGVTIWGPYGDGSSEKLKSFMDSVQAAVEAWFSAPMTSDRGALEFAYGHTISPKQRQKLMQTIQDVNQSQPDRPTLEQPLPLVLSKDSNAIGAALRLRAPVVAGVGLKHMRIMQYCKSAEQPVSEAPLIWINGLNDTLQQIFGIGFEDGRTVSQLNMGDLKVKKT